jgi:hypothetical protein
MDLNKFKGFYPALDRALDIIPHDRIKSFIFTRREDFYSVGLIMHYGQRGDRDNFEKLVGKKLDDVFYSTEAGWASVLCVDLESIGTGQLRLYKDQPNNKAGIKPGDNWIENVGYYIDENDNIVGSKTYTIDWENLCYIIDYYDANGAQVKTEHEVRGTIEDWNGPQEIVDIVTQNNIHNITTKKVNKDQAYFIVTVRL